MKTVVLVLLLVAASGARVSGIAAGEDRGDAGIGVARCIVVLEPNCSCTPLLEIDKDCTNSWLNPCTTEQVTPGVPNSPECNAITGCKNLINCQMTAGQVSITESSTAICTSNCTSFTVQKNNGEEGTLAIGAGAAIVIDVGGSPVACTDVDNEEANGDEITIICEPQLSPSYTCTVTVTDKCLKCGGSSDG